MPDLYPSTTKSTTKGIFEHFQWQWLHHCLSTLSVKKLLLISSLNLPQHSLSCHLLPERKRDQPHPLSILLSGSELNSPRAQTVRSSPWACLHLTRISHSWPCLLPQNLQLSQHPPSQAGLGGIKFHKLMLSRQSRAAATSRFGLQITPRKTGSQPWELIPQHETAQLKTILAARPARMAADRFPKINQFPFCNAWCPFTYIHLKIALPFGSRKRADRSERRSSLHTHTKLKEIKHF